VTFYCDTEVSDETYCRAVKRGCERAGGDYKKTTKNISDYKKSPRNNEDYKDRKTTIDKGIRRC